MDPSVAAAQRAYGYYQAGRTTSDGARLLAVARSGYADLLLRARNGDRACVTELARLLGEVSVLADLQLDPCDIAVLLPDEWMDYMLDRYRFTTDQIVRIVTDRARWGTINPALRCELVGRARALEPAAIAWVEEHGTAEERRSATMALGRVLVDRARALYAGTTLSGSQAATPEEMVRLLEEWAATNGNDPALEAIGREARAVAVSLRYQAAAVEGQALIGALAGQFRAEVADLASWYQDVEHYCRRLERWIEAHGANSYFEALKGQALNRLRHARQCGLLSAQQHMRRQGFADGLPLPAVPTGCFFCGFAPQLNPFCTQCGARQPQTR